jgi:hypothetical protein
MQKGHGLVLVDGPPGTPPDARHTAARIQKADRSARLGSSAETVEAVAEGRGRRSQR